MKKLFLVFAFAIFSVTVKAQPSVSESPRVRAKKVLTGLTLERKVAQLVCVEIRGDAAADDPHIKKWLSLVRDHGIGGFVIYGGTARNAAVVINKLQAASAIPILISTDFE